MNKKNVKLNKAEKIEDLNFHIKIKFKNKKQKELSELIKKNRITFITGSPGTGKAQPLNSKILTPGGWVNMGEVSVGDIIIGKDGKLINITGIFPQGEKDIYEVIMDDGSKTKCCDDHLWETQTIKDRKRRISKRNENNNLIYQSSPLSGSPKTLNEIRHSLFDNQRLNHYIPIADPMVFKNNNSHIKIDPYILGLLIGDGGLTQCITLTSNDENIKQHFEKKITEKFNNLKIIRTKKKDCKSDTESLVVTKINSYSQTEKNELLLIIRKFGLNVKSNKKFIPHEYLWTSIENRKEMLQGLMDSDGYIDGVSIVYTTISKELVENFCFLVKSLGGTYKIRTKIPKYKGILKIGQKAYYITFKLGDDIIPFKLERKKEKYLKILTNKKYYPIRRIEEVNLIGKEKCQCIMVSGDDNLYITDDFIVTHNTIIALKTSLELLKDEKSKIGNIILSTPIISVDSVSIGYLPGDEKSKTVLYFEHFYENLNKIIDKDVTSFLRTSNLIEEKIINFVRGTTFGKYDDLGNPIGSLCLLDESQNTTILQLRTYISRLGENSKMVILGDLDQTDIHFRNGEKSGLHDAIHRFKNSDNIGIFEFTEDDIVRDSFLIGIMKKYKK